jgi:membrane-bound lytic murein transglycosylase D
MRIHFPDKCNVLRYIVLVGVVLGAGLAAGVAQPAGPGAGSRPAASTPASAPVESDQLFELGKQLFEQLASPEVKAQFEFPTKEQWDAFGLRLQHALEGDSLEELAGYGPEARLALTALRSLEGYEDLADWLEQRIDEIDVAKQLTDAAKTPPPKAPPPKVPPQKTPAPKPSPTTRRVLVPHYDVWLARVRGRPLPSRAQTLMPQLRAAFVAEGVPAELAWLAEAESSLNPSARSPVGAKGLFQFMPDTARSLGLGTFLPDERTNPEKSAHAAARYLRMLHGKFGSWPLALAAYNAGEGRVARTLAANRARDYAVIAHALPAETRMYVPKIAALITLRTGKEPEWIGVNSRR